MEDKMTSSLLRVWVFFYGTIMNPVVMKEFGVITDQVAPATLSGFDIIIRLRLNLVRNERTNVFGSL
jgi:hypothetical protein